MSQAEKRRQTLLAWLRERPEHYELSAQEIVDVAGIYTGHGRYDRCFDDLKVLERRLAVRRYIGRPARWSPR